MNITLTPEIEEALAEKASQAGVAPEELALDILRKQVAPQLDEEKPVNSGRTMYDRFKDHIGVISYGKLSEDGTPLSINCGKKFAEGMMEKYKQGKL